MKPPLISLIVILKLMPSSSILRSDVIYPSVPQQIETVASDWITGNLETIKVFVPSITTAARIGQSWRRYSPEGLSGTLKASFPNHALAGPWQVACIDNETVFGRVIVSTDSKGARFSGFTPDPFVERFIDAARVAGPHRTESGNNYEIREYIDSALKFHAIWLHSALEDLMIPLALPDLDTTKPIIYTIPQIQDLLRPRVERLIHEQFQAPEYPEK